MIVKNPDEEYRQLKNTILMDGIKKMDRTGTGTISTHGALMRFDISNGRVPLLQTKLVRIRSIIHELLWMLSGSSNIKYLKENNVSIWDEWADENGDLGPVYGKQWRSWEDVRFIEQTQMNEYKDKGYGVTATTDGRAVAFRNIDQISRVVDQLINTPYSRRILLSAWNVALIEEMNLPPCHMDAQWLVHDDVEGNKVIDCVFHMRSTDVGLGLPFNIVQYSLLTQMLANVVGYKTGELVYIGGDVHIYDNHADSLMDQMARDIEDQEPRVILSGEHDKSLKDWHFDDFELVGYDPQPAIKMPVAV